MSEISNNREYYINQLKILNPELDYSKLSDEQLRKQYEELQSALNKGSNWGKVGDAVEIVNPQSINNPNPPQLKKHILPEITPEQSIPKLTEEVAQEVALQNLSAINSELDYAIRDEKDRNNDVSEMLFIEGKGIEYLEKTRSSEGLTVKQYLQGLRDDVKHQIKILYPNLDENKINLDERLNTLDIDQLKGIERGLINAGLGRIDKAEVLRSFAESTQSVVTSKGTSDVSISNTIKNIKQPYIPSNGDDLMSFEQVYRIERGVEFNPDKIRQYLIDGTVNFYSDPFENGLDIERFNKDMEYRNRFPQSYIQAFGQPYRAEYNTVLKNSHFDTNLAYGVEQVKLNSDLKYDNEGTSYVIPTRDLTYNQEQRELNPQELKRFAANTLYNTLNNAYMILRQYHDGIYDQLSAGSVGAGAIQGFQRALGMDTVNDKLDQIGNLLNKARNLKDLNDNEFNKRFDEIFGQITGESFNPEYMLKFAQLTIKGVKAESDEYDNAVTKAFGKNITGDVEKGLDNLSLPASITDIAAFLSGSEILGSTKLFQMAGLKSFQITAKAATRLGFNPVSKGVQTGVRLLSSSPVSAGNMITFTGITELTGIGLDKLAQKIQAKQPLTQQDFESVMDNAFKSKNPESFEILKRFSADLLKQGAMGSVAPFIGAVANKTGESLATVFSKGNPTAIQKSFSVLAKAENKTLNAQSLMKDYFSALDTPAFTKAQQVISKSSSFLTEVAGFTGYSILEHIAEGVITGELDLDSIDLGEEFKGQIEGLGTLKTIARFIQMKKSGAIAKDVQNKALNDMTEQLKEYDITDVGGQYRVLDKTSGKFQTFNSPEQAVNHLFQTMLFKSAVAKAGVNDGVEWRKMNIGGEEVEVAVTKNADGKETVDSSKARKLNANGEYENFALTTKRDLLSGEGEVETEQRMSDTDFENYARNLRSKNLLDEEVARFNENDILTLKKLYQHYPEMTKMLLDEQNGFGDPRFNAEDVAKIIEAGKNYPEELKLILAEKTISNWGNVEVPKYNTEKIIEKLADREVMLKYRPDIVNRRNEQSGNVQSFRNIIDELKRTNFEGVELFAKLTTEERATISNLRGDTPCSLALFATGNKPAVFVEGLPVEIGEKLKGDNVDVMIDGRVGSTPFLINKTQVKTIIEQNKELFAKRFGLTENSAVDEIYNKLIETSTLAKSGKNDDIAGLILGYPRTNSLIFNLEFHMPNGHNVTDRYASDLTNFRTRLKEYLFSDESPYKDMSDEFKQNLATAIDNITEIKTGSYVLSGGQENLGYPFNMYIDEPKEIDRIRKSIDNFIQTGVR